MCWIRLCVIIFVGLVCLWVWWLLEWKLESLLHFEFCWKWVYFTIARAGQQLLSCDVQQNHFKTVISWWNPVVSDEIKNTPWTLACSIFLKQYHRAQPFCFCSAMWTLSPLNPSDLTALWPLLPPGLVQKAGSDWWGDVFAGHPGHCRSGGVQRHEGSVHEDRGGIPLCLCHQ